MGIHTLPEIRPSFRSVSSSEFAAQLKAVAQIEEGPSTIPALELKRIKGSGDSGGW
jgi:hypothetical protein